MCSSSSRCTSAPSSWPATRASVEEGRRREWLEYHLTRGEHEEALALAICEGERDAVYARMQQDVTLQRRQSRGDAARMGADAKEAATSAEEDWANDSRGAPFLTRALFLDSVGPYSKVVPKVVLKGRSTT